MQQHETVISTEQRKSKKLNIVWNKGMYKRWALKSHLSVDNALIMKVNVVKLTHSFFWDYNVESGLTQFDESLIAIGFIG